MYNGTISRVSKAIIETPNSSDYETLVAKRAIEAMREISDEALLAPGIPYAGMINKEEGLKHRRAAWESIIDSILNA